MLCFESLQTSVCLKSEAKESVLTLGAIMVVSVLGKYGPFTVVWSGQEKCALTFASLLLIHLPT